MDLMTDPATGKGFKNCLLYRRTCTGFTGAAAQADEMDLVKRARRGDLEAYDQLVRDTEEFMRPSII